MMEHIGKRILEYRKAIGMSQETLSLKSGVCRPLISSLENGKRKDVLVSTLSAIAEALGTTVNIFLE